MPISVRVSRQRTRQSEKGKLVIRTANRAITFKANYAPREVEYSGYESVYQELERPGRKPLLRKSGESLRRISMELFIGSSDIEKGVNQQLVILERLAATRFPLFIQYEPRTYGRWRIETMSYSSVDRRETSNRISRALVSITFVEIPPTKKKSSRD